jgi:tRNA-specific 2-thiouridylase
MRALALFSGGLDSVLAMKVIIDQGIEVIAVNVNFGFGSTKDRLEHMQSMCDQIGAKLEILDLRDDYLKEVLFSPVYGYGKNFNPCIDCHGFMFRHTAKLLEKYDASFMISGEVVGQRPMSQRKDAMMQVQKLSDHDELILRPLSAKLMEPTKPEIEGWVDRDKLLAFEGRGRQNQLELAKKIGLENFESPGGGCLLTEENTARRIRDFIAHDELAKEDIDTLKYGRHLRLPNGAKLIIGRNKDDNEALKNTNSNKYLPAYINGAPGPFCLFSKNATNEDKELATKLIITYGKTQNDKLYEVDFKEYKLKNTKFESKQSAEKYFI